MNPQKIKELDLAVSRNNLPLAKLLIEEMQNPDVSDEFGSTVLLKAVITKQYEMAKMIIDLGANVNAMNQEGNSPLMRGSGNYDLFRYMSKNSGDPNLVAKGVYVGYPLLHDIAQAGDIQAASILLEYGADIDILDGCYLRTALMAALDTDVEPEMAKFLIEKGANVNINDKDGNTAYSEAIKYQCYDVAELLVKAGAIR